MSNVELSCGFEERGGAAGEDGALLPTWAGWRGKDLPSRGGGLRGGGGNGQPELARRGLRV